eukprot:sb/3478077/
MEQPEIYLEQPGILMEQPKRKRAKKRGNRPLPPETGTCYRRRSSCEREAARNRIEEVEARPNPTSDAERPITPQVRNPTSDTEILDMDRFHFPGLEVGHPGLN